MSRSSPTGPEPRRLEPARLAREDRRDALLDATAKLLAGGTADAVSVESVAEIAGVSRPLVYKHFANRDELLSAVYKRESDLLYRELSAEVEAADSLEEKLRALIRGSLRAQATRGATLAALRGTGVRNDALRERQRRRDRNTVRYFGALAAERFGLDDHTARSGVSVLLGAIETIIAQWRRRPTHEHAEELEHTYAALAMGGLAALATR